jgi:hypothetical protein
LGKQGKMLCERHQRRLLKLGFRDCGGPLKRPQSPPQSWC